MLTELIRRYLETVVRIHYFYLALISLEVHNKTINILTHKGMIILSWYPEGFRSHLYH